MAAKVAVHPARRVLLAPAILLFAMQAPVGAAGEGLPPDTHSFTLEFGGRSRSYVAHVPPQAANGSALPVILNFHGGGSNAAAQERYSGMDVAADRDGFIAAYPNGTGRLAKALTWNAGACCVYAMRSGIDDVGFTRAVLDDLAARTRIDRTRVYATGISNGAMMAYRLGAEASDRIVAIAPVEGALVAQTSGPGRAVPLMAFNSMDDRYVPYQGGYGRLGGIAHAAPYPSVDEVLARWRAFDACPAQARIEPSLEGATGSADAGNIATRITWGPCAQGSEIVLWKLGGSGHVWPGATRNFPLLLGRGTGVINANEEMWSFFRRFSLPSR